MRGDRVGVGDIVAVHDGAWGAGDTTYSDDRRGACGHRKHGIVSRFREHQLGAGSKQGGSRVDVNDGSREWFGGCCVLSCDAVRANSMRGDRMGVGDICAVQGGAWGSRNTTCGDDGRGEDRQRDRSILDGHWKGKHGEGIQQGGDRVGISDGARGWTCGFWVHGDDAVKADGMRGDSVGVGYISARQHRAWV